MSGTILQIIIIQFFTYRKHIKKKITETLDPTSSELVGVVILISSPPPLLFMSHHFQVGTRKRKQQTRVEITKPFTWGFSNTAFLGLLLPIQDVIFRIPYQLPANLSWIWGGGWWFALMGVQRHEGTCYRLCWDGNKNIAKGTTDPRYWVLWLIQTFGSSRIFNKLWTRSNNLEKFVHRFLTNP